MNRKNVVLIFLASTLLIAISSSARSIQATSYAPTVDFDLDKQTYRPGDKVIVTINSPLVNGALLVIDVVEGNSDRRIFHTSQIMDIPEDREVIAGPGRHVGMSSSSIAINFTLPYALEVPYYRLQTAAYLFGDRYGTYLPTYTRNALIFTNEDARRILVTDVKVDTEKQYHPGDGIPISFQVKDGRGMNVQWARPTVTMCNGSKSFCPSNTIESPSDIFTLNFGIPRLAPEGRYQMTISPGAYPAGSPYAFDAESVTISGIAIAGSAATSEHMEIAQYFGYKEGEAANETIPEEFMQDGRLKYGQTLVLSSSQDRLLTYGGEQVEVPLHNVVVNFQIIDPDGNRIFNESRVVDENGRVDNVTFPITHDLKRGTYELYHRPTKDGIDFHSGNERFAFEITNLQKIEIKLPSESGGQPLTFGQNTETVYFDSRDLDVIGSSYDWKNKTLSFDLKNNHLYNHRHHDPFYYNDDGVAYISIPKHLLADPLEVKIGDRMVDFALLEKQFYFSAESNESGIINPFLAGGEPENNADPTRTKIIVGPVYDNDTGKLTVKLQGVGDRRTLTESSSGKFRNIVNLEDAGFLDGGNIKINETDAGIYVYPSAYAKNHFDIDIPFIAVAEIRNATDGVTEFLQLLNGTVNAYSPTSGDGSALLSVPWQPKHQGQYEMRLFLISNSLDREPYVLTDVSTAEITVNPAPPPEFPPVPDLATTIPIGESKEISLTSYERDPHGEKVKAIINLNNVTIHTGDIENLLHKNGLVTLFLNFSMENTDNYAYYADPAIEAIVDGDYYPPQLTGGALGSVLLPHEKRDSFVAIQVVEGASQVTFDVKDLYTKETIWQIAVNLSEH